MSHTVCYLLAPSEAELLAAWPGLKTDIAIDRGRDPEGNLLPPDIVWQWTSEADLLAVPVAAPWETPPVEDPETETIVTPGVRKGGFRVNVLIADEHPQYFEFLAAIEPYRTYPASPLHAFAGL